MFIGYAHVMFLRSGFFSKWLLLSLEHWGSNSFMAECMEAMAQSNILKYEKFMTRPYKLRQHSSKWISNADGTYPKKFVQTSPSNIGTICENMMPINNRILALFNQIFRVQSLMFIQSGPVVLFRSPLTPPLPTFYTATHDPWKWSKIIA